ncbi:MAG: hypothetical protein J2P26_10180 [Nocardiopsaceae bacterium]|nr:hypothetical protein [Nocardiopsaceae bacterium]
MPRSSEAAEPLGVLLLPGRLEGIALEKHARGLLSIPRVVALEPPRIRLPRLLREMTSARQADRLRFPGRVRLLVLYDPAQYPLARALFARNEDAELWYIPPPAAGAADIAAEPPAAGAAEAAAGEPDEFDALARGRAVRVLEPAADGTVEDQSLRQRLRELGIISPHAFIPARAPRRRF